LKKKKGRQKETGEIISKISQKTKKAKIFYSKRKSNFSPEDISRISQLTGRTSPVRFMIVFKIALSL